MTIAIEVEDEAWANLPGLEALAERAVNAALSSRSMTGSDADVFVLFTDDSSIAAMNAEWRGSSKPTNVLSFPTPDDQPTPVGEPKPLGDIVLALGVTTSEAEAQGKTLHDHCTHLIVHGCLHLLGHDHEDEAEAFAMERLEIEILRGLGISNPYE
jgi:probable rRNA maturation factor